MITRRELLFGAAASAYLALPGAAGARGKKVFRQRRDRLGRTLWMRLDSAPFPCKGFPYTDRTVVVFVPARWRPPKDGGADVLVYFHGHRGRAGRALERMRLRQQVVAAGGSSLLVVPQLAHDAVESHAGRLEQQGGLRRMLAEALAVLARRKVVPAGVSAGRVRLAAHSGGFQAAAMSVARGKVPVSDVYLFDALYGFSHIFDAWLAGGKDRRLISLFRGDTGKVVRWTRRLKALLDRRRLPWLQQKINGPVDKKTLRRARAVFLLTGVGHMDVPWKHEALRRCLESS